MFKGAPLSCLIALLTTPHAMGSTQLVQHTGFSHKSIGEALTFLSNHGIIVNFGGYKAWMLNPQFPLDDLPQILWQFSNNSDNISPTTTTINKELKKEREVVAVESLKPVMNESHALLRFAGIGEPMASILAKQPNINPYSIAAHYAKALADKIPTGLLIHRLKAKDSTPELNTRYHILNCTCPRCDHLRFSQDQGYLDPDDFDPQDYLANFSPPTAY